jgi:hypothetical protein
MNTLDWKNATPEQKNLWKIASAKIAYTTITPLYFFGFQVGSEFLTYNAGKLYIALSLAFDDDAGLATSGGMATLYDEANSPRNDVFNVIPIYVPAALAIQYINNYVECHNVWFSRLQITNYDYMQFNGYRLNV